MSVDWDDVNGTADYLVNQQLRAPCQELNNGVSGAANTSHFLRRLSLALWEGVILKGFELNDAPWSQVQ